MDKEPDFSKIGPGIKPREEGEKVNVNIFTEHPLREAGIEKLKSLGIDIPQQTRMKFLSKENADKPQQEWYNGQLNWEEVVNLSKEDWVSNFTRSVKYHLNQPGSAQSFS